MSQVLNIIAARHLIDMEFEVSVHNSDSNSVDWTDPALEFHVCLRAGAPQRIAGPPWTWIWRLLAQLTAEVLSSFCKLPARQVLWLVAEPEAPRPVLGENKGQRNMLSHCRVAH